MRGAPYLSIVIAGALSVSACALDERSPGTATNAALPAETAGAACGGAAGQCAPGSGGQPPTAAGPSDATDTGSATIRCSDALDCPARAPECVQAVCSCSLSAEQLATDAKNCGGCANDCSRLDASATCQQGRCVGAGEPAPYEISRSTAGRQAVSSIAAGQPIVLRSSRHTMQLSIGQPPGGNQVSKSTRFELVGGVVGASQ